MIKILIADDHPIAREGIIRILQSDPEFEIIGEADNGLEAQELVGKLKPDILLLDLKMPGPKPFEIEKWVRSNYSNTITLVLTAHDRDIYLSTMFEAGVSGYMSKSERGDQLIQAIHRAVNGDNLFTEDQLGRIKKWQSTNGRKLKQLTNRERKILLLICQGLDNTAIARTIGITNRTTAFHITNILRKIDVTSRQQAVAWAHQEFGDDLNLLIS